MKPVKTKLRTSGSASGTNRPKGGGVTAHNSHVKKSVHKSRTNG